MNNVRVSRLNNELTAQLEQLIYPGFLTQTPGPKLLQFPRYIKGMSVRIEKFANNPGRDESNSREIHAFWHQYLQRLEKHRASGVTDEHLEEFRWQIEELRISLFAQELKTPYPVSVKRLQKLWECVHA